MPGSVSGGVCEVVHGSVWVSTSKDPISLSTPAPAHTPVFPVHWEGGTRPRCETWHVRSERVHAGARGGWSQEVHVPKKEHGLHGAGVI